MGRLFWKFFLIFWVAQVVTAAGVGVAVWLEHSGDKSGAGPFDGRPQRSEFRGMDRPPPPEFRGADGPRPHGRGHPPTPLLPILAGSLVSLIFAALLASYFARPIRNLRAAFESVADGKLETRIGASMGRRNDELADLGSSFDHMAGRLESLIEAQRRLLHDVSHELRSPLARLQAAADLMQQQPERAPEFVERIQRDTVRMDILVGELLTLARLDAAMTNKLDEHVDLGEVIEDVADDARLESDGNGGEIQVDVDKSIVVRGNRELLHRAIENVVRNAVRHSPQSGTVSIRVRSAERMACVTVTDSGPGVADADLVAIFEPFVRSGPAAAAAGYGLGLAITRRVVEAHGGRVFAANRPGGGLSVTLEVPAPMDDQNS